MCIDYQALNKAMIKNRYPLFQIDDILDQLRRAINFSKLDLHSRYCHIRVCNRNVEKKTC